MQNCKMTDMLASIFELAEAKKRAGHITEASNGSHLKRGRADRAKEVVATTMFCSELPGHVPVRGTIELGISKQHLSELIDSWEQGHRPATFTGTFEVNSVASQGTLTVDFAIERGELVYAETPSDATVMIDLLANHSVGGNNEAGENRPN